MSDRLGCAPCADGKPRGSMLCWSKASARWTERCSLAGPGPDGPPSAALACPGAAWCLPSRTAEPHGALQLLTRLRLCQPA